mmetsp:Transcript_13877/g.37226  ORF Transcript_13877/g.37226 Transcript_13877/m.37226 type:complete len:235 (-) Transcript_13877:198-902(-)
MRRACSRINFFWYFSPCVRTWRGVRDPTNFEMATNSFSPNLLLAMRYLWCSSLDQYRDVPMLLPVATLSSGESVPSLRSSRSEHGEQAASSASFGRKPLPSDMTGVDAAHPVALLAATWAVSKLELCENGSYDSASACTGLYIPFCFSSERRAWFEDTGEAAAASVAATGGTKASPAAVAAATAVSSEAFATAAAWCDAWRFFSTRAPRTNAFSEDDSRRSLPNFRSNSRIRRS